MVGLPNRRFGNGGVPRGDRGHAGLQRAIGGERAIGSAALLVVLVGPIVVRTEGIALALALDVVGQASGAGRSCGRWRGLRTAGASPRPLRGHAPLRCCPDRLKRFEHVAGAAQKLYGAWCPLDGHEVPKHPRPTPPPSRPSRRWLLGAAGSAGNGRAIAIDRVASEDWQVGERGTRLTQVAQGVGKLPLVGRMADAREDHSLVRQALLLIPRGRGSAARGAEGGGGGRGGQGGRRACSGASFTRGHAAARGERLDVHVVLWRQRAEGLLEYLEELNLVRPCDLRAPSWAAPSWAGPSWAGPSWAARFWLIKLSNPQLESDQGWVVVKGAEVEGAACPLLQPLELARERTDHPAHAQVRPRASGFGTAPGGAWPAGGEAGVRTRAGQPFFQIGHLGRRQFEPAYPRRRRLALGGHMEHACEALWPAQALTLKLGEQVARSAHVF